MVAGEASILDSTLGVTYIDTTKTMRRDNLDVHCVMTNVKCGNFH
jgi:hypothetical protein